MSKRVLLTGYNGFLGQHSLRYWLAKTDWTFHCVGRKTPPLHVIQDRVSTYDHDLTQPISTELACRMAEKWTNPLAGFVHFTHPNVVINMASDSRVEVSVVDPVFCLRNNHDLMLNVLEYARHNCQVRSFIHVSTDEVYGSAPPEGHKEWSTILPSNPYAASKATQEAMAIAYWQTYQLPLVIVNVMNVIGEGMSPHRFVPRIIEQIAKGQEVTVFHDAYGHIGSRVYIDAENVADALKFLAGEPPAMYGSFSKPDRYNICGDTEITNLEMARLVADIMGVELKYRLARSESARPGYEKRHKLDGTKLRELGWSAPVPLRASLERIVRWTLANPHW